MASRESQSPLAAGVAGARGPTGRKITAPGLDDIQPSVDDNAEALNSVIEKLSATSHNRSFPQILQLTLG
jgi:hypothetical protein